MKEKGSEERLPERWVLVVGSLLGQEGWLRVLPPDSLVNAVLVAAPLCVVVVLVVVLPLDACAVHGDRGHQALGLVTAAAEARLETIFKFLAHKI